MEKILGVINLAQINNWENTNWESITFDKSKNTQKTDHFKFSFKENNLNDLLSFQFSLIDSGNKKIHQQPKKNKNSRDFGRNRKRF